jgi:hypothetical protein
VCVCVCARACVCVCVKITTGGTPNLLNYCLGFTAYIKFYTILRYCKMFCNPRNFYGKSLAPRPTPKLEDNPFSGVHNYLFSTFAPTIHICWPFLHPQPEVAPCCSVRDPLKYYSGEQIKTNEMGRACGMYGRQ